MNITNLLMNFWDYSIILPAAFLCILPVLHHSRIKSVILLPVMSAVILIVSFVLSVLLCLTEIDVNILLLCALLPALVFYFIAFDVRNNKLWYIFVCAIAVFSFGGLSTHYIEGILESPDEIIIAYSIKWLISVLFLAAEIIFLKQLRWLLDNENVNSIWKIAWMVPALIIIFNFFMIPSDSANIKVGRAFSLYIMYEITLIIFFVIFLVLQYAITKAITTKTEAEHNTHILSLQAAQYENLKKYLDDSARLRHDFVFMAKTARSLAASGEIEQLQKLLNDYGYSIDINAAPPCYCDNPAVNAITAHYVSEARKTGIHITVRLNVSKKIIISDYEICSIVGNILDNAVSAAEMVKNAVPEILFVADTKPNGDLYIAVSNSYDGNVIEKGGKFRSTKADGHAVGLESVRAIVRENKGYCNFRYDGKKFYSEIMLRQEQ